MLSVALSITSHPAGSSTVAGDNPETALLPTGSLYWAVFTCAELQVQSNQADNLLSCLFDETISYFVTINTFWWRYAPLEHEFQIWGRWCKQDRRWNADKPSAALDPYILTWLTTSPANHRPANFLFFFTFKGNCEMWCNLRSNWWASTSNLNFPFSDSLKYK